MKKAAESASLENCIDKTAQALRATLKWKAETTGWAQGLGEVVQDTYEVFERINCQLRSLQSQASVLRTGNAAAPFFTSCIEKDCLRICRKVELAMPQIEKRLLQVRQLGKELNWLTRNFEVWNEKLEEKMTFIARKSDEIGSELRRLENGWYVFSGTPQ